MSISIQTNVTSLIAQNNLRINTDFQSQTIQRLTSGYRINSSGDDAAGLATANKYRSDTAELTQGVRNANHELKWEGAGKKVKRTLVPPTPEKLKTIRDLVSGIAGLSTERGDLLVVETLPFESTLSAEPPSEMGPNTPVTDPRLPKWLAPVLADGQSFLIAAVVGAVLVVMLLGLAFLLLKKKKKVSVQTQTALQASAESAPAALPSEPGELEAIRLAAAREATQRLLDEEIANQLKLPILTSKKAEILVNHLRESVKKDSVGTTNMLKNWLAEKQGAEAV